MADQNNPLVAVGKGILSGLVGTAVITIVMRGMPRLMQRAGLEPSRQQKRLANMAGESPAEQLARKVADGVLDERLAGEAKHTAGEAIHWSYGLAWGGLYGILQSSLKLPHHLHGLVFGGLVSVVAATTLPAMKLTPPPQKQPLAENVMMGLTQLLYGWVTAYTFHLLNGGADLLPQFDSLSDFAHEEEEVEQPEPEALLV